MNIHKNSINCLVAAVLTLVSHGCLSADQFESPEKLYDKYEDMYQHCKSHMEKTDFPDLQLESYSFTIISVFERHKISIPEIQKWRAVMVNEILCALWTAKKNPDSSEINLFIAYLSMYFSNFLAWNHATQERSRGPLPIFSAYLGLYGIYVREEDLIPSDMDETDRNTILVNFRTLKQRTQKLLYYEKVTNEENGIYHAATDTLKDLFDRRLFGGRKLALRPRNASLKALYDRVEKSWLDNEDGNTVGKLLRSMEIFME